MSDYISAVFPEADQKRVAELIQELKALLPFGLKLSSEQKKTILRMDDKRLPFVEKGLQFGKQEPKILPPYTNLDEMQKDFSLNKALKSIEVELSSLAEIISDTRAAAGADAYQASLSIYKSAQGAAKMNVPGTQTIVDEMSKLFSSKGSAVEKTTVVSTQN